MNRKQHPSVIQFLLIFALLVVPLGGAYATLKVEPVFTNLQSPWAFAFISDTDVLITLKGGEVLLANLQTQQSLSLVGVPPSVVKGQGGLLDIELHPQFNNNQQLYLSFAYETKEGYTTALAKARLAEDRLLATEIIFVAEAHGSGGRHFGSRLEFDDLGYLYMTIGDRGQRDLAQDLSVHQGKIVRLHDDGRVPEDNPFVGTAGARPEIYSYGHRNPQGMVFDHNNKRLWIHEHGPRGGDELNLVLAGKNYGWPLVTFGREYYGPKISDHTSMAGMESPVFQWTPSIAPSGMDIYRGELFKDWQDDILVGALKYQLLTRVEMKDSEAMSEHRYLERSARIRDVKVGADGAVYVLTDAGRGQLWRVTPEDIARN